VRSRVLCAASHRWGRTSSASNVTDSRASVRGVAA
jgi:hypothetical protein